ncbi:MAG: SRPBCC family protein [Ilumatobacteraceae bacterium]
MEITRDLIVPATIERTFALVDDLGVYPTWLRMVHAATPDDSAEPDRTAGRPAWIVELRAQVGPFARSKRLRMVRSVHEPSERVRFERAERDGRSHAPWTLEVELAPGGRPPSTRLTMRLHYGGRLFTGAVLQRVLDDEIEQGSRELVRLAGD